MADVSEYEVRCPRCDVSFPTGTKKCLHCGGATGPSLGPRGRIKIVERAPGRAAAEAPDPDRFELAQEFRAEPIDGEPEEEQPQRSGMLRALATVVWILIAIGISFARSCSEGG